MMHPLLQQLSACPGVSAVGACSFAQLMESRPQARDAALALCPGATSVLVALFPYFSGRAPGNLSLYARGRDYHLVVSQALTPLCRQAKTQYPARRFVPLCDASPLPEVAAASLSGAGTLGDNGLIFDAVYGSFVFIGCILTDLIVPPTSPGKRCPGCGACRRACPTQALSSHPMAAQSCLSALTQRGGALSPQEQTLLAGAPLIWGCDSCSLCCPLNASVPTTHTPAFCQELICQLNRSDVQGLTRRQFAAAYPDRAFTWKGPAPLLRNLTLQQGDETP